MPMTYWTPEWTPGQWPGLESWKRMSNEFFSHMMPKELAGSANLAAYPAASFAAASALGIGAASQVFGLWMGSLTASMETAMRLSEMQFSAFERPVAKVESAGKLPAAEPKAVQPISPPVKAPAEVVTLAVKRKAGRSAPALEAASVVASAAESLPTDFRKPSSIEKPEKPDDLKAIGGIGPKLEQVLNGLGVWTYAQVAGWDSAETAWVDDYLGFRGRIERDGWLMQASTLEGNK